MLRQALVLLAVTSVALAAVAIMPLEEKPEEYQDCEGCWVSEIEEFIPLNETFASTTQCVQYRCSESYVQIESCGVVAVEKPCYKVRDLSLPYPGCCERAICPK